MTNYYFIVNHHGDKVSLPVRQYVHELVRVEESLEGLMPFRGSPGGYEHRKFYHVQNQHLPAKWFKMPNSVEREELKRRYPGVRARLASESNRTFIMTRLDDSVITMSEKFWTTKVKMTCEEKTGKCQHEIGHSYTFDHALKYPEDMCIGIYEPARTWLSHCAMGIPSWESDDDSIYRIHCISKKGTVWRIEKVPKED